MTAQQEQLIVDLEKVVDDIETIKQGLTNTFSAGLNALENSFLAPPSEAMNWLRDKANESINSFNGAAVPAQNYCNECIANTQHCFRVSTVEEAYRNVDLANASSKCNASTIAGDANTSWVSANRDAYVTRLGEMEDRVQRVKGSLDQLVESFAQMAQAMEDRDVDLALALASIVVTIVSIVVAIKTWVTGWGAIIGLALAVISFAFGAWSFVRAWNTVPDRCSEMINGLTTNAQTIGTDRWPAPPRLDDSTW